MSLFIIVDPIGLVPYFRAITPGLDIDTRRSILRRGVLVGFFAALLFVFFGKSLLAYMGVSVNAFSISGGILLFLTAVPMLLGHQASLQSSDGTQPAPASDIAIYPLAFPWLSGAGTMTTLMMLMGQTHGDMMRQFFLVTALTVTYGLAWSACWYAEYVFAHIGDAGANIAARVMGILLAALSVQNILNGITGYMRLHGIH